MGMPVAPTFDQDKFRARTAVPGPPDHDDAFDSGDAAADTNWSQPVDQQIRVRFVIQQTNAAAESHANLITNFLLQYNTNSGGWNEVGVHDADVEDVQFYDQTSISDGDPTETQILGSGTFVNGLYTDEQNGNQTTGFTELALTETELEVSIEIVGSNVTITDTIELRFLYSADDESPPATVLEAYTSIPEMTAAAAVIDPSIESFRRYEHMRAPNPLLRM